MKKLATLALFATVAAISQAQVNPTGPFATLGIWQENFDTIPTGPYNSIPLFSGWGGVQRIGTGNLQIQPGGAFSPPRTIYGNGADMRFGTFLPMKRFSGWFKSAPIGVFCPFAKVVFKDASGSIIGSVPVTLSNTWTFHAWVTTPNWSRVEVFGSVPGFPGVVAMDSLRMRPW